MTAPNGSIVEVDSPDRAGTRRSSSGSTDRRAVGLRVGMGLLLEGPAAGRSARPGATGTHRAGARQSPNAPISLSGEFPPIGRGGDFFGRCWRARELTARRCGFTFGDENRG